MSDHSFEASPPTLRAPGGESSPHSGAPKAGSLPPGLVCLRDGLYFDTTMPVPELLMAVGQVFAAQDYFVALHYAVFLRVLYNVGPPLAHVAEGARLVHFAARVARFDPKRRALYRPVRVEDGVAEYLFEERELRGADAADPERVTRLDFDEFVAEMWRQGVRFGIDAPLVEAAIALGRAGKVGVARRLAVLQGRDAMITNLQDMNRSYVPRQLANGRLDLLSFKSHSPRVRKHARLLKKTPGAEGFPGYELSGQMLAPEHCHDLELAKLAGLGTAVESRRDGEFLIATQDGYMNVDPANGLVSVDAKIVSYEGVSNRTTGNLQLSAEYEEHGEVQELRRVEGGDITIHGDVFGIINSRGGKVLLHRNVIGGSVQNADGDIEIKGIASGAVLQTKNGTVCVERAESCIISGARVLIGHASNCEIIADEVQVELAEGCAIAGRRIDIDGAGPRKQIDMLVFALVPDMAGFNDKLAGIEGKAAELGQAAIRCHQEIDRINQLPEVRNYQLLSEKLRKQELVLSPDQVPQFQKMAAAAAAELKTAGRLWYEVQQMDVKKTQLLDQVSDTMREQRAAAGQSRCYLRNVNGETLVRGMTFDPQGGPVYDKAPKDIKATLRGAKTSAKAIFSGSSGTLDWVFDPN